VGELDAGHRPLGVDEPDDPDQRLDVLIAPDAEVAVDDPPVCGHGRGLDDHQRHAAGRLRLCHDLLDAIASHRVADRPDRYEPRLKKRRRNYYDWLTEPRAKIKRKMAKGITEN
jgi:hypothetical protein